MKLRHSKNWAREKERKIQNVEEMYEKKKGKKEERIKWEKVRSEECGHVAEGVMINEKFF